jgi:uncharacterized membrane protein YjjP (DUF1212 family)
MSIPALTAPITPTNSDPETDAVAFVLRLARALHASGYSAQGLEETLSATSDRLGLRGHQFFSTPTAINAAFGPEERQRTHLLRVEPGEVNLGRLAALEKLAKEVTKGDTSPAEGSAEIDRILATRSPYGPVSTTLAFGLASGAACQFLGGGAREIAVGVVLGLGLGVFALFPVGSARLRTVFEPASAFLISAGAIVLAHLAGPFSVPVATLAGLIILLPGLTLTTAIGELATRNLGSGTLRLSGAFITFLSLGFGSALGNRVAVAALGTVRSLDATPLPAWTTLVAVVLAALSFTIVLAAQPRDALPIVATGALGVIGGRFGAAHLGPELGAFVGAFGVAMASSLYARTLRRPAAVVLVPGILMLVPGSVGFRSLLSLMDRRAVAGLETAFSMMLTAVALVAGLLIANAIAPERRIRPASASPPA